MQKSIGWKEDVTESETAEGGRNEERSKKERREKRDKEKNRLPNESN